MSPGTIVLPKIRIAYGDRDAVTKCFIQGYVNGWNAPIGPPPPLDFDVMSLAPTFGAVPEEWADAYQEGFDKGQEQRNVAIGNVVANPDDYTYDGPTIGPAPKVQGIAVDAWDEEVMEFLNHRHEPHVEAPELEIVD